MQATEPERFHALQSGILQVVSNVAENQKVVWERDMYCIQPIHGACTAQCRCLALSEVLILHMIIALATERCHVQCVRALQPMFCILARCGPLSTVHVIVPMSTKHCCPVPRVMSHVPGCCVPHPMSQVLPPSTSLSTVHVMV